MDATAPDAPQQFLKLIKTVRRAQWLVNIVPDGAVGDTAHFDLLGRKVAIGQGAALIARKAGAATFFARSVWTGQGFDVELTQGPTATPESDPEGYDEEFHAFYTEQLGRILRGAPVDMAPLGGFWDAFA